MFIKNVSRDKKPVSLATVLQVLKSFLSLCGKIKNFITLSTLIRTSSHTQRFRRYVTMFVQVPPHKTTGDPVSASGSLNTVIGRE